MANYNFKENPTYQTQIRAWSNSDPANAETVLNPVVEAALNNTHAVKISVDQHKDDGDKHITSAERKKLKEIDEGANKYTHPNSGVTAGTYRSVTVNASGHVTSGSNPTTISGYGLTDAYTKTEVDTKINTKANTSALTDHTGNSTVHITSTERTNWNDANGKKHEHSNKSVLDGITSAKASNWDTASTNSHTHSNKTVLDGVTSAKVTNWDSASTNSHTHSNKAALDSITSAKTSNWDSASTNNHTHSNKTVLDGVTSTKLANWDTAASNSHTHSNKSILDSISQTKVSTWDGYDQKITNLNATLEEVIANKSLWEGTWSSGSITVAGVKDYTFLLFFTSGSATPIPVYRMKSSTYLRGSNTLVASDQFNTDGISATLDLANNRLTLSAAKRIYHYPTSGGHSTIQNLTISEIVGVF